MRLTGEERVHFLLTAIPYFHEVQHLGNYYVADDLYDILDALERADLTEKQREAVRLVYVEDRTQTEAGHILGVSQSVIKRHLKKALTKITEAYEGTEENGTNATT